MTRSSSRRILLLISANSFMNQARLAGGGRSEVAQYHIDPLGEFFY